MGNRKHQSSVYYDKKDKRWKCAYYIMDKETYTEKRKNKSFFTEKDAKEFAISFECQKEDSLFLKNNGIPLCQFMRANAKKRLDMNLIKENTYLRLIDTIKIIEKSPIATKNIDTLTEGDIQDFLNSLTKNYCNSTIKKIKGELSRTFKKSNDKGYISKNPMSDVIRPKSEKKNRDVRALSIEEQQKFTNYLMGVSIQSEPYKVIYLIEMYLGLRISEVLALRTSDIDLQKNLISINKTLSLDKDKKVVMGDTTKTYAGVREVPIPEYIRGNIIEQMKIAENNTNNQLFLDKNGNYIRHSNVNRRLKEILSEYEITGITTHSLRHTYATRCIEAGMRAVAVQRLMGHTDITITLNTYASIFNKYKESELEKVNQYYMNNDLFKQIDSTTLLTENIKTDEDYER